jgi:hypothetical protein
MPIRRQWRGADYEPHFVQLPSDPTDYLANPDCWSRKLGFSLKLDREVENHSEETKVTEGTKFPVKNTLMWY